MVKYPRTAISVAARPRRAAPGLLLATGGVPWETGHGTVHMVVDVPWCIPTSATDVHHVRHRRPPPTSATSTNAESIIPSS